MKRELRILAVLAAFMPVFCGGAHSEPAVNVIHLEGVINPVAADYIINGIERAEKEGAACLVIELDTPGGLMESMRLIVKEILGSSVPVVVYVAPGGSRAASAGVFITLAAHVAAMAPGTNIGAAHPVNLGGQADTSGVMSEKIENDAAAYIRSIATERHRNADWAEKTVRESISSTAEEALKNNAIDYVVSDLDSLLAAIDGLEVKTPLGTVVIHSAHAEVRRTEMTWREELLKVISDPNIAYILMMLGIYGIFFELYNPGMIFPGVVGALCLILAFYSFQTLPVNYAGLLLIALGALLFILEVKIISYGLLSAGGVASMLLGSIMLIDSPLPFLKLSWKVILPVVIGTALFFFLVVGLSIRTFRRKVVTGLEGMIGETGTAQTALNPEGQIMVHGELWNASSDEPIDKGGKVEVISAENLILRVTRKA